MRWDTAQQRALSFAGNLVCFDSNRRRGGIGRRAGLKIQWPQGRVGSSPSAGNEFSIQWSMSDVQRSTAIDLSFGLIWEKMLPDRFVGIAGFAFGILPPHIFQCHQRAILTGIGGAHCAGNVCQPWRRRFFFEFFRCSAPAADTTD